jgi:hypothetical protein
MFRPFSNRPSSGRKLFVEETVPLATEPYISLIILTPMKILQRNLNRGKFVVWEKKRNVSVVCVCSAPNCCDTEQRSASQPGSIASGTLCIIEYVIEICKLPDDGLLGKGRNMQSLSSYTLQ